MRCPCGNEEMIEISEDIDIGVGTQHHVIGWECDKCGAGFGICNECGEVDFMGHSDWCSCYKRGK
jgi:hypothetical protein